MEHPIQPPHKLLVVEDNNGNMALFSTVLQGIEGLTVSLARTAEQADELLHAQRFDILLLDLQLPGMNGEDLLARLKDHPSMGDPTVIIVSADATDSRIRRLIKAGAHGYITKPIDIREFTAQIERAITQREAHVVP